MFIKKSTTILALAALCSMISTQSVFALSTSVVPAESIRGTHEYSTLVPVAKDETDRRVDKRVRALEKKTAPKNEDQRSVKSSQKGARQAKSEAKCSEALSSEGCFTDCLARNVPPDVVLSCAEACGNLQVSTCAVCLGVGIYVVWSCYNACGFAPEAPPEN